VVVVVDEVLVVVAEDVAVTAVAEAAAEVAFNGTRVRPRKLSRRVPWLTIVNPNSFAGGKWRIKCHTLMQESTWRTSAKLARLMRS
jgi:hypothetical protein